jgi:Domain of unknown function (DUF4166)
MRGLAKKLAVPGAHPVPGGDPAALGDLRFRQLLGAEAWAALPAAVRARFGKHLGPGASANYVGEVLSCKMNAAGWLLAQACRMIGAPLPLERAGGVAAVVSVTEDGASGGQIWTRMYARKCGFPQVIHSVKRFAGPTGLEEYLGAGVGIALTISAHASGIRFNSDHYFLQLRGWRLQLPRCFAPGHLTIDHQDCGGGSFTFALTLRHPVFGELMHQLSRFADQAAQFERA